MTNQVSVLSLGLHVCSNLLGLMKYAVQPMVIETFFHAYCPCDSVLAKHRLGGAVQFASHTAHCNSYAQGKSCSTEAAKSLPGFRIIYNITG